MPWLSTEEYIAHQIELSKRREPLREEAKLLLTDRGIEFKEQRNKMLLVHAAERLIYYAPATGRHRFKGEQEWRKAASTEEFIEAYFPHDNRPATRKTAMDEKVRRIAFPARGHSRSRVKGEGAEAASDGRRACSRST